MNKKVIGFRFKCIRKKKKLNQSEIAKKLGVSRSMISLIESGDKGVSVKMLFALREKLGVSSDYILFG